MTVLLRVEAGPQAGLGHLRRSISLAQALGRYQVDGFFLVHPDSRGIEVAAKAGQTGDLLRVEAFGAEDARQTVETASRLKTRAVMLDYHDIPEGYVEALRSAGLKVMVRDDTAIRALPADLVVNGNADAEHLGYRSWGGQARLFLGPRYAVLPPDCWQPPVRIVRPKVGHLLVSLGGSDAGGLLLPLLERLERMPESFKVTAVIGPFVQKPEQVRAAAGRFRRKVSWVSSPDSLVPLILQADLAVTAAGQTLYELACLGCPAVAVQVADNQAGQLKAMAQAGAVSDAGRLGDPGLLDRLEKEVSRLIQSHQARTEMAKAGQQLIDGKGADRVAQGILEVIG